VVSPIEYQLLREEAPEAQVELLSNVHAVEGRRGGFGGRHGLVFVGGFGHPPNVDAVHWLVEEIFPRIRQQRTDIVLHLIGDMPQAARESLARPGIHIHGRVEDLAPWMDGCRVAMAPLRYGAGVKGKINMAMSHGLPVVATPMAAEGMYLVDGENVLLATNADAFAAAALRLHEDEQLWLRLSDASLDNVREHFSFETARRTLQRLLP
jgi:glycosyltransferase involved in cell wall biosynthesis